MPEQRPRVPVKGIYLQAVAALFSLALLSSCEDTSLPHWFTGEPDESVAGAAADHPGITRIGQGSGAYPNLATVPDRPKTPANAIDRTPIMDRMEQDNAQATNLQNTLKPYLEQQNQ